MSINQDWKPNFLETSPIFEPLKKMGPYFKKLPHWPGLVDLEHIKNDIGRSITNYSGQSVSFVPQNSSVHDFIQKYEPRIYLTGEIQTRQQNWHDLFNALVWLTFPRAKAALNQLHYQAMLLEHQTNKTKRGPLRDAATLFDESGVIVMSSDINLIKLIQDYEWKELFWEQRKSVLTSMRFFIFGHGLYEKALNPYLGMTGHGIAFKVEQRYFYQTLFSQLAEADMRLEQFLIQNLHSSGDMTPVPVLGYPGWSDDNAKHTYYDNRKYFRLHPRQRNQ